ncbi:MAG: sulfite exporter TauE/SafE family protein [Bacteroidota bacterium]
MLPYLLICIISLVGSGLTFFSGFGLGTILMPVFALYFPLETAVALTAIVHFLNNVFKLLLVYKHANKQVVLKFGLPSVLTAIIGAYVLLHLSTLPEIYSYNFQSHLFKISGLKLILAALIIFFCLFDLIPALANLSFNAKYLPLGGALSGFFGGLSGNQGALRSAFLLRAGLNKESYIATGVLIACMIDISRLSIYAASFNQNLLEVDPILMIAATLSAFAGAFIGNRLIKKVTIQSFKYFVASTLIIFSILLASGIL